MDEEIKIEGNLDINEALKEFEEKSKTEALNYKAVKFYSQTDTPKIVQLVIKWSGGTITQRQAEYFLLGLVVIMLALSFYFFFGNPFASNKKTVPSAFPGMGMGGINPQP